MGKNVEKIISKNFFIDEKGTEFNRITKEISIPRKTYLKGTISGKYRGDRLLNFEDENNLLYDFEIYEAAVICNSIEDFRKNQPFKFPKDFFNTKNAVIIKQGEFPKNKLPDTLEVNLVIDQKTFGVNIIKPKLFSFKTVRRLHQIEGDEVFGTFNAFISGYIFDYEKKIITEDVLIIQEKAPIPIINVNCESDGIKTGNERKNGNNYQKEYHCKHHNDTVWINDVIIGNPSNPEGCLSIFFGAIGIIFGIICLLFALPLLVYILPFLLIIFIINLFERYLKWFFGLISILLIIGFFSSLIHLKFNNNQSHFDSGTEKIDNSKVEFDHEPNDNTKIESTKDIIVTKHRIWKDYDGIQYEGKYQLSLNDYKDSNFYKSHLNVSQNSIMSYDSIIWSLKNRDKNKLNGLYKLFDSIKLNKKISKVKFAEIIVSFVQDIPYSIVLEDGCVANFYNDQFTKMYLQKHPDECDSYQKFGINSPVEFLMKLKGDCDTRTLLLYTIFTHYNYDVALLSSEFYGHSLIGINLPINGATYNYNNQKYVLWETTSQNCKPGIITNEISNLNNWRISLKSE